jgi:hypothetical protein
MQIKYTLGNEAGGSYGHARFHYASDILRRRVGTDTGNVCTYLGASPVPEVRKGPKREPADLQPGEDRSGGVLHFLPPLRHRQGSTGTSNNRSWRGSTSTLRSQCAGSSCSAAA